MRNLLQVMAEPALAKRDQALRASLLEIVGKSKAKTKAVLLMDGSRSQAVICKESGIDHGNLSRLVKALRAKELIKADEKHPELAISVPPDFFENPEKQDE
jgi:DNA-binding MarR family transcriptional regulator